MNVRTASLILLHLALAACSRSPAPEPSPPPAAVSHAASGTHPAGIDWFEGTVDEAFAAAAKDDRPLFLYWGAEWCPPCKELKGYVFTRADFREKMQQFVPVYIDGDAPGAQGLSDKFGVIGYPTAIVFRADRSEVARIFGGLDLARFANVLDLALEDAQPLATLLESVRDGNARLSERDCERLAYNGWIVDPQLGDDPAQLAAVLDAAAGRCADALVRTRLTLLAAGLAASAEREALEKGAPASERLTRLTKSAIVLVLAATPTELRSVDALLYSGDFFAVAARLEPDWRKALLAHWIELMNAFEHDERYSDPMQLSAVGARLEAAKALSDKGEIPPQLLTAARASLEQSLALPRDDTQRAAVVNAAEWVLDLLHDDVRLRQVLEAEIRSSSTPYYYMPSMAALEEKAGNKGAAVRWSRRGYDEARGPATRFSWGSMYLEGLMRLAPEDEPQVRAGTLAVLGELEGPDRIHDGTRARLARLSTSLKSWAGTDASRRDTLTAIGARWSAICAGLPAGDAARAHCGTLLAI